MTENRKKQIEARKQKILELTQDYYKALEIARHWRKYPGLSRAEAIHNAQVALHNLKNFR